MPSKTLTEAQRSYFGKDLKKLSPKSHKHMVEQIKARTTRPDLERFIVTRIPHVESQV